ncbi:hypothetical protein KKI24_10040 [bacterium]|nr:hypothetical protein [bacterium]
MSVQTPSGFISRGRKNKVSLFTTETLKAQRLCFSLAEVMINLFEAASLASHERIGSD